MKYICLRDDDTNFYTEISELEEAYGKFWGNIPVTLATVPFAHGSERRIMDFDKFKDKFLQLRHWEVNADMAELSDYHKLHPIGENTELVSSLKKLIKKGMIEIAQHGVTHKYAERGPEMFGDRVSFEDIRSGKEYLEKVFDVKVNIFIPPSNTIDDICVEYIDRLGMVLFSGGSIRYSSNIAKIKALFKYPISTLDKCKSIILNNNKPIRNRNGIFMFGSVTYNSFDNREEVLRKVITRLNQSGFVSLASHYRLFENITYRENYYYVLNRLSEIEDVKFVTAYEYFEKMKQEYYKIK